MAISRVKTWSNGEVLTHTDLNAEFDNILNNALSLVSPLTSDLAFGGFRGTGLSLGSVTSPSLQFTGDANTGIFSTGADVVDIAGGGATVLEVAGPTATALVTVIAEDARTNTVDVPFIVQSTTTGAAAAGIGTGIQFNAESADEAPSVFGSLNFTATDIGAGSEDTDFIVLARTGGAAAAEIGRMTSLGGFRPGAVAPAAPAANTLFRDSLIAGWATLAGGGTPTLGDDFNVSGIVDDGAGIFTITWDTDIADANYATGLSVFDSGTVVGKVNARATTSIQIVTFTSSTGVVGDPSTGVSIIISGG